MALIIMPSFAFCSNQAQSNQSSSNKVINELFEADVDISISAKPSEVQLFEGSKTAVYTYQAELITGDSSALQKIPYFYLAPIIRVKPQQKIRIRFHNELAD